MALSGVISKNITGRQYRIEWSATQSISNNTSTITCVHKLVNNPTYSLYISAGNVSTCNVGGVEKSFTNPAISTAGGTTHTLGTTTHTVSHNSDGTKSVTIKGSYNINATLSGTWTPSIVAEGTITLDTIPRTSAFSVSKTTAEMNTSVTFSISRASTALTHKLTLTWGGVTSTIASNVATSYSWKIPISLASDLPSSTSSGCIITCITYNGSTELGRTTLGMVLTVPASIKPSISTVTIAEAETDILEKFGVYLQSKSKLSVKITAAGSYSSTIKNYSTEILGKTYSGSDITTNTITGSGSIAVKVTVTDTRGRTATTTRTITVTAYSTPTVSKFTAQRCDASGNLDDEGEYVKLSFAFNIVSLNSKNDKSYSLAYKLKEDTDYTELTSGSSYSLDTVYTPSIVFSADYSYDFALTVSDYFDPPITHIVDVQTGFTLMDFHSGGRGMAIGKVSEKANTLEVSLNAEFNNETVQKGNSYVFSTPGVSGSEGYVRMVSIEIVGANADTPLVFEFCRRGESAPMRVYIQFGSVSGLNPGLSSIRYEGNNYGAFLFQPSSSVWDLYVQKVSAYDTIALTRWSTSRTMGQRVSLSFPGDLVSQVPTPYWRATPAPIRSLLDYIYPVGSIYISYSHNDPSEMFGGTWTRINNAFLWATTSSGTIGQTGGESEHTLTLDELPEHHHGAVYSGEIYPKQYAWYTTSGSSVGYDKVYSGGNQPHNNMPPYIQVSMWRRIS